MQPAEWQVRSGEDRQALLLITGAFRVGGGVAALNRLVLKTLSYCDGGRTRLTVLALNEPESTPLDPFYAHPQRTAWRPFGERRGPFILSAWREALRRRWDLIFSDQVGVASVLYPLARLGLCRYTVSCNGLELLPALLSFRRRLALFAAERRLAISPTTRDSLLSRFPGLEVRVYELGLDPKLPLELPSWKEPAPMVVQAVSGREWRLGDRVILCVGRMWRGQRHKGQDALIRAVPLIRERVSDAQLVLAGGGDWVEDLRGLARTEGVEECVFFPGYVSDEMLQQLYSRCFLFAMPSKGEGFGLVYLEAMRWSKPCIGGALDAARDVIVDGETGVLVADPHDARLLADALCRLLKDPETARAMGRAGRKRLGQRYLFSHFQDRFLRAIGWA